MSRRCMEVDRLSSLPEDILSAILSLIPTKLVVRTSILSKRWRYTWTLIHNLDFDDNRIKSYSHVERVLMLCKTTRVKIFRLHFFYICVPKSTVSKWISEAVRLNVCELDIQVAGNLKLPLSLFTCNTLSKLRIVLSRYNDFTWDYCPRFIYLPNLKTLDIINSTPCEHAFRLIQGCPLLEDLSLEIIGRDYTEDCYFKSPTLKRLRVTLSFYTTKDIHKVVLNLPSLEHLCVEGHLRSLFVIEDLSSLVKAKVSCGANNDHLWVELLKGLSKVRNLTLAIWTQIRCAVSLRFPEFPNVKKLVLATCDPFRLSKIPLMLKRFCQLEHLCIKKEHEALWSKPESFPTLTITNIVTVKYTDTTSTWGEFDTQGKFDTNFLKFILANAIDLKKLIVRYNSDMVSYNERERLDAELSMFPRASRNCQIHLAPYN